MDVQKLLPLSTKHSEMTKPSEMFKDVTNCYRSLQNVQKWQKLHKSCGCSKIATTLYKTFRNDKTFRNVQRCNKLLPFFTNVQKWQKLHKSCGCSKIATTLYKTFRNDKTFRNVQRCNKLLPFFTKRSEMAKAS